MREWWGQQITPAARPVHVLPASDAMPTPPPPRYPERRFGRGRESGSQTSSFQHTPDKEISMSVQARFFVRAVEKHASGKGGSGWAPPAPIITVRLSPINGSKGSANKEWASATPSGEITMTIGNPAAAAWFEERLGEDVAITFADPQDD